MKKFTIWLCCVFLALSLSACSGLNEDVTINPTNEEDLNTSTSEYLDEFGYPLPGEEYYEKWYNAKLEKVISALDEANFVYGKILSVERSNDGQTRVVICASDDMNVNLRKNYSFIIRDNAYIMHGVSEFDKNDLLAGQKVFVSFASAFEDTLEYSGGEHSVEMFSLFVLDDDPTNPGPLTPEDNKYYDIEGDVEVEVEIEVETDDGVLE